MKTILFGIIFLSSAVFMNAQEVILDMDVDEQYKGTRGPNMRHYYHFYMSLGAVIDVDGEEGTAVNVWPSGQYLIGYRYKLKLLSFYAIGLDLSFKRTQYALKIDNDRIVDLRNPLLYPFDIDRHKIVNNGLGIEFYHRINIGKRGNTLGNYLDTGIRGQWNFSNVETLLLISDDDSDFAKRTKIKNRQLSYVEPFSYGLTARLGFNRIVVHANYRLSDYFREWLNDEIEIITPELPRLIVGAQIVL